MREPARIELVLLSPFPFSPLVAAVDMAVNQREFDKAIHVDLILADTYFFRSVSLETHKGTETGDI